MQTDLYPTFAALAGAKTPSDRVIDGRDIGPLLDGRELDHNRTFYWSYAKEDAMQEGDWKLHLTNGKVDGLFDLSRDPDEKNTHASAETARVERMLRMLKAWKAECEAAQAEEQSRPIGPGYGALGSKRLGSYMISLGSETQ